MFNQEFYPTPIEVINKMIGGINIQNKIILEPSAGKGDIVKALLNEGAKNVLACEINDDLRTILENKCTILEKDFFNVQSHQISHIDAIIMNPPFSNADKHILHAYEIAPDGCIIIALCNANTLTELYSETRKRLKQIADEHGQIENLGNCFNDSERYTNVNVSMLRINKPGEAYKSEFDGFFMDADEEEPQENALMSYNVVRDLVNRYVASVKIFDEQLEAAAKMNELTSGFYSCKIGMSISRDKTPITRNEFKKEMQKSGWNFIFKKMNMEKYATRGLKEDINKFVEQQENIPFTMKNIYRMLEIVIGTQSQRVDKAIIEVFEKITKHYDGNKYNLPGWKTNSHYLVNKKFIFPYIGSLDAYRYMSNYTTYDIYYSDCEMINDLEKALCYITGENWDNIKHIYDTCRRNNYGQWYECHFFRYKAFKKGTLHVEFKDEDTWAKFNQNVSRIKGYPIYEHTKREEKKTNDFYNKNKTKATILETIKI